MEDKFIETLKKYGYKGKYMSEDWLKQPLFIQSFAPTSLVYVSSLIDSPKIFLIDDVTVLTEDTKQVLALSLSDLALSFTRTKFFLSTKYFHLSYADVRRDHIRCVLRLHKGLRCRYRALEGHHSAPR